MASAADVHYKINRKKNFFIIYRTILKQIIILNEHNLGLTICIEFEFTEN